MKNLAKIIFSITAVTMLFVTKSYAQVSVGVSIQANIAPPEIPVYVQPACPVDGYLWQPGYWAYDPDEGDYYWVPGVWVSPPDPGLYWTPCYWGYDGGVYLYHAGYWGPHVGFYGGINYGGGFFGVGFAGGGWSGGHFRYNTAVVNVNRTVIHNTYTDRNVISRNTLVHNRVSYNGGNGVNARPRPEEQRALNERHMQPTRQQMSHQQAARGDRNQFAKANHGAPAVTAMRRVNSQRMTQHANNPTGRTQQPQHNQRTQQQRSQPQHNQRAQQQRQQPQQQRQQPQQQRQQPQRQQPQRQQPQRQQPQQQRQQPQRQQPPREKH